MSNNYQEYIISQEILNLLRNQGEQITSINNRLKIICGLLEQVTKSKELENGKSSEEKNREHG